MDDTVVYVHDNHIYESNMVERFWLKRQSLQHPFTHQLPVVGGSGWSERTHTFLGKRTDAGYVCVLNGADGVMIQKKHLLNESHNADDPLIDVLTDEYLSSIYTQQRVDCYAFEHIKSPSVFNREQGLKLLDTQLPCGIERYATEQGDLFIWCNDVYILDSLKNGTPFEADLVLNTLKPFIQQSRVILDIGAHIGCHSVMYKWINPNVEIHAFEPQKAVFTCLQKNVEWNGLQHRVTLYNTAVGHTNTSHACMSAHISDGPTTDRSVEYGSNSFGYNLGGLELGKGGEVVNMITIDSLGLKDIDFIKIDVEGFEPLVLMGAEQTIKRCHPVIMFECNYKRITRDMVDVFALTDEQSTLTSFSLLQRWGYVITDLRCDNFLAQWTRPIHISE
jgi:FkbM family methyltransferase